MIEVEPVVRGWLAGRFPSARVSTKIPADLASNLPLIRVWRIGGNSRLTLDTSLFGVDVFAGGPTGYADCRSQAEEVRSALVFEMPGNTTGGLSFLRVTVDAAPVWLNYDNPNAERFTATYEIYAKPAA